MANPSFHRLSGMTPHRARTAEAADGDAGHKAAGKVGHTDFTTRAVFRLPALSMSDRSGESVEMG
jgi:hypothetical protein